MTPCRPILDLPGLSWRNPAKNGLHAGRGFSLIEMLVVMGIVAIMTGIAMIGFGSIGRGASAQGATDLAASMALAARVEAMSLGYGSYLIIDNSSDVNRRLQRMAVLRLTNSTDFELKGKPVALPRGTFFLPEYSSTDGFSTNFSNPEIRGIGPEVFAYKFDGSGHLAQPTPLYFVFSANSMLASGDLQNPENLIAGRKGFVLRKNGRPVFFQNPDQITPKP